MLRTNNEGLGEILDIEAPALASAHPQPVAQLRIREETGDRGVQTPRPRPIHEEAILAVHQGFELGALAAAADHRQPAGQRVVDGQPCLRGQHQHVRGAEEGRLSVGVVDRADEMNAIRRQPAGEQLEPHALGSGAHDERMQVPQGGPGDRLDQAIHALVAQEPPDEEQHFLARQTEQTAGLVGIRKTFLGSARRGTRPPRVDGVGDHPDRAGIRALVDVELAGLAPVRENSGRPQQQLPPAPTAQPGQPARALLPPLLPARSPPGERDAPGSGPPHETGQPHQFEPKLRDHQVAVPRHGPMQIVEQHRPRKLPAADPHASELPGLSRGPRIRIAMNDDQLAPLLS